MCSQVANKVKPGEVLPTAIHHHFSRISNRYRYLGVTDSEPIAFIARELGRLAEVKAADIGCGVGRYNCFSTII